MSKLFVFGVLVTLITLCVGLQGCGNKGELYRESDIATLEEIEKAAEKLKKSKKSDSDSAGE